MILDFRAVEEVHDDGTPTTKTFEHVPSEIGAEEAEEVGVEHLLRDIKDTTIGTLSQKITNQLMGLKGLEMKLKDMHTYLEQVRTFSLLRLRVFDFDSFVAFVDFDSSNSLVVFHYI